MNHEWENSISTLDLTQRPKSNKNTISTLKTKMDEYNK